MGKVLKAELEFFRQKEPEFIKQGHYGEYVAIHGLEVLAFGTSPTDVIKNLLAKFNVPPEPILIRQVVGDERRPLRLRSPRAAKV